MQSTRILIRILILSIAWLLIHPNTHGAGQWIVLRNDDFERNDGVESHLQDVHFIDAQHGWTVGSEALILHTADSGKTWTKKEIEMERPINLWNIYFYDENVGFITGVRGTIFKTEDAGKTWERKTALNESRLRDGQPVPLRRRLTDTWMISEQIGFTVGENSTFIKTTDGGENWIGTGRRVAVGYTRQNLEKIFFASPTHGWIVGFFGTIKHTADGGETWKIQNSDVDYNLKGIHFVDPNTGWIVGQEGMILHTQDGGATWTQQETEYYDDLHDVVFIDKQTGWTVGAFGTILHTTDGGQTWVRQETGHSTPIYAIYADKAHCWAVGEWGLIIGYTHPDLRD